MPSNQFLRNKKQVFVLLKLISGNQELTSVVVYENQNSKEIRNMFMRKCEINDPALILKLRNQRGSIVPFSYQSFENTTREEPYFLEAVKPHSTVPLSDRTVQNDATYSIEVRCFTLSCSTLWHCTVIIPDHLMDYNLSNLSSFTSGPSERYIRPGCCTRESNSRAASATEGKD